MRHFYTSVLERRKTVTDTMETAPYECAWATEAIFYLRTEALDAVSSLSARAQISPDGIHWMDEGTELTDITEAGDRFMRLTHFGGWLRLVCRVATTNAAGTAGAQVTIHLALKE